MTDLKAYSSLGNILKKFIVRKKMDGANLSKHRWPTLQPNVVFPFFQPPT